MKRRALTCALAAAAMALGACGPRAAAYPAEYQQTFKASCAASNGTPAYCDCVWDKIERDIPVEEFIGFDAAAQNHQPHPLRARIEGYTRQCLSQGQSVGP